MKLSFCAGSRTSSRALAGIALVRHPELVDLVEQEHGILGAGLLHALQDAPGQRADVGAPVAADVGLVAGAAERDADVLAPHRARDRLRDRGLADARRSGEEQDPALAGGLRVGLRVRLRIGRRLRGRRRFLVLLGLRLLALVRELANRQEFQDAILDVLQSVVILVEDPCGLRHIELFVGCACSTAARRASRGRSG